MFRFSNDVPRRSIAVIVLAGTTLSAAGAATYHRFAVVQSTGSGGATNFLQSSTNSSALEGNVGGADTTYSTPFAVFGAYNASNSPFGIGVLGASTTGYGVAAESLSDAQPSMLAYPGGNGIGLEATTIATSTNPAIFSESKGPGDGIDGATINPGTSNGILGEDLSNGGKFNDGVRGTTTNGGYGVEGDSEDNALGGVAGFGTNAPGVYAVSESGLGVSGMSTTGDGVAGSSTSGSGVNASNTGSGSSNGNNFDVGLKAQSVIGNAIYASTGNFVGSFFTNNSGTYDTMVIRNQSNGTILQGESANCTCLTLDGNGNLAIAGAITDKNGTFARTRNPSSDLVSYGAETTQPTIEDVGRAELAGGTGAVSLAADFRQTIEGSSNYLVFLTPRGDTNGLYVASQNANGFVVRESHGGRSSIAFDYRIVAQRYGMRQGRLPHYAALHPEIVSRATVASDGGAPRIESPHSQAYAKKLAAFRARTARRSSIPAIVGMPTREMFHH